MYISLLALSAALLHSAIYFYAVTVRFHVFSQIIRLRLGSSQKLCVCEVDEKLENVLLLPSLFIFPVSKYSVYFFDVHFEL